MVKLTHFQTNHDKRQRKKPNLFAKLKERRKVVDQMIGRCTCQLAAKYLLIFFLSNYTNQNQIAEGRSKGGGDQKENCDTDEHTTNQTDSQGDSD